MQEIQRTKRAFRSLFVVALVAGAASVHAAADCTLALWGDSILYGGFSADPRNRIKEPPVAAIKRLRPAWLIADFSVVGDSAYKRMPSFVTMPMPTRVVVLEYGINDAGNGYDYEPSLRAMVKHVKAAGKTPIVTGLSRVKEDRLSTRNAYHDVARRVAHEEGAVFADWGAVRFDPADMADTVHPAQPYSTRLVEQLVRSLDEVAPDCKPTPKKNPRNGTH